MKAITLVKCFTLVLIFLTGVAANAAGNCGIYRFKEDCVARKAVSFAGATGRNCSAIKKPDGSTDYEGMNGCKAAAKEDAELDSVCAACDSKADLDAEKGDCNSKFDSYISKLEATNAACAKADGGDINSCTRAANACGMVPSSAEDSGGLGNLIQMMTGTGGSGGSSGGGSACTLYDDTFEDRKAQIEEQISRMEDEKVETVTKQADLDDELNQKKQEVNEKISDLEAEFRKDEKEAKSQAMDEATELQKKILASNKKIRDNLAKVADKNTEIANLSFGVQQIVIESSNLAIKKMCLDRVNAAKAAATAPTVGTDGKKKPAQKTRTENAIITAGLRLVESQCLEGEGLKRNAQLKGIADKKRSLLVEVDTFMKGNEDELKSIELDKKALEEKAKFLTENEKKALEEKNKKLDDLSKSVSDMAAIVERKKKALDAKIAARDAQIMRLNERLRNLKPRFNEVQSSIGNSRAAASAFRNACCINGKTHSGCPQVKTDSGATGFGDFTTPGSNR